MSQKEYSRKFISFENPMKKFPRVYFARIELYCNRSFAKVNSEEFHEKTS